MQDSKGDLLIGKEVQKTVDLIILYKVVDLITKNSYNQSSTGENDVCACKG